ncbi:hypothetical protein PG988_006167 [Apiospora saccharicola]
MMNRRQQNTDGRQQRAGPVGKLVRGLATGIGLATESYQHHKDKKAAKASSGSGAAEADDAAGANEAHLSQQMDEAVWELDEAQDQLADHGPGPSGSAAGEDPALADNFIRNHPPPRYDEQNGVAYSGLALPVVITQRRPGSRTRGFPTFLDFLDNLNKSVEPSPWIQTINLASFAGQAVPEPFTIIISIAVKKVTDATSELHSRSKTNKFLDQINESFFAPRGLVALIMTWKPSRANEMLTMAEFNMDSAVAKASGRRSRFESSSGASSFEWPETAPLAFPTLDELADSGEGGEAKKQSAIKRGGNFVGQYMDKRARAEWAGKNPESSMANAAGKETFASRYSDPNHPASSGDPIALLTGGFIQSPLGRGRGGGGGGGLLGGRAGGGRADSRGELLGGRRGRSGRSDAGESSEGGRLGGSRRGGGGLLRGGGGVGSGIGPLHLIQGVQKLFQDDVLYLMIVQRPTEEQMAEAVEHMRSTGQHRDV